MRDAALAGPGVEIGSEGLRELGLLSVKLQYPWLLLEFGQHVADDRLGDALAVCSRLQGLQAGVEIDRRCRA